MREDEAESENRPLVYGLHPGYRLFLGAVALAGIAGGLWFACLPWIEPARFPGAGGWLAPLFGLAFAAGLGLLGAWAWRARAEVHPWGLRIRGLGRPRVRRWEQLAGYRILKGQHGTVLALEPAMKGLRTLKVELVYRDDGAMVAAARAHLPDLDQVDARAEAREVLADMGPVDPDTAGRTLRRAQVWGRIVNSVGVVAALWAWAYPVPYRSLMALLLAWPLVALSSGRWFRGLLRLDHKRGSKLPHIALAIFSLPMAMALRAMDWHLLRPAQVLAPGAWVALGVAALAWSGFREVRRPKAWFFLALFAFIYGTSAIALLDAAFDGSQAQAYHAAILSKRYSSGKTTSYYFTLSPWGPRPTPREVSVDGRLYRARSAGDSVEALLAPGRLGLPWFWLR